jgi:hypothetical protein
MCHAYIQLTVRSWCAPFPSAARSLDSGGPSVARAPPPICARLRARAAARVWRGAHARLRGSGVVRARRDLTRTLRRHARRAAHRLCALHGCVRARILRRRGGGVLRMPTLRAFHVAGLTPADAAGAGAAQNEQLCRIRVFTAAARRGLCDRREDEIGASSVPCVCAKAWLVLPGLTRARTGPNATVLMSWFTQLEALASTGQITPPQRQKLQELLLVLPVVVYPIIDYDADLRVRLPLPPVYQH